MKYALVFAATAAASYDAYGSYPVKSTSAVMKPSTTPEPVGYTTIHPGYGKQPVTVTSQHQPYPTCVSAGYGGKECGKWEDDIYVSTTIKDYDQKVITVTEVTQPVTVYHTKYTITHSATGKMGYPTASAGYALPSGISNKTVSAGCWYELYEKVEEVPYNKLGRHAMAGYPGSGLYPEGDKKQPVYVKEYKGGKWSEYEHVYSYGIPKEEVTTYGKPGVYTVPAKTVIVDYPVAHPAEATKTAKAGETCTYGVQYIDAKRTGYVTGAYGAYETKVIDGEPVTETVVKYTTVYVTSTGKVMVAEPTTTVYDHDTMVAYPTAESYAPGVYKHEAKTITVTKGGEAYTCSYEQAKKYSATQHNDKYPAYPAATPAKSDKDDHKPSAIPSKPTAGDHYPVYPTYPAKSDASYKHEYPASSIPIVHSKSHETSHPHPAPTPVDGGKYPHSEYPAKSTSSSCPSSTPVKPSVYTPVHGHPEPSPSVPAHGDKYPAHSAPAPVPAKSSAAYPVYPAEPYHAQPTPVKPSAIYPAEPYHAQPTPVKPSAMYPAEPYKAGPGYIRRGSILERRARAL